MWVCPVYTNSAVVLLYVCFVVLSFRSVDACTVLPNSGVPTAVCLLYCQVLWPCGWSVDVLCRVSRVACRVSCVLCLVSFHVSAVVVSVAPVSRLTFVDMFLVPLYDKIRYGMVRCDMIRYDMT